MECDCSEPPLPGLGVFAAVAAQMRLTRGFQLSAPVLLEMFGLHGSGMECTQASYLLLKFIFTTLKNSVQF